MKGLAAKLGTIDGCQDTKRSVLWTNEWTIKAAERPPSLSLLLPGSSQLSAYCVMLRRVTITYTINYNSPVARSTKPFSPSPSLPPPTASSPLAFVAACALALVQVSVLTPFSTSMVGTTTNKTKHAHAASQGQPAPRKVRFNVGQWPKLSSALNTLLKASQVRSTRY